MTVMIDRSPSACHRHNGSEAAHRAEGAGHRRQLRHRQGRGARVGAAGADVIVNYVAGEAEAEEACPTIREGGSRAVALRADVSQEDDVLEMFEAVSESSVPSTSW